MDINTCSYEEHLHKITQNSKKNIDTVVTAINRNLDDLNSNLCACFAHYLDIQITNSNSNDLNDKTLQIKLLFDVVQGYKKKNRVRNNENYIKDIKSVEKCANDIVCFQFSSFLIDQLNKYVKSIMIEQSNTDIRRTVEYRLKRCCYSVLIYKTIGENVFKQIELNKHYPITNTRDTLTENFGNCHAMYQAMFGNGSMEKFAEICDSKYYFKLYDNVLMYACNNSENVNCIKLVKYTEIKNKDNSTETAATNVTNNAVATPISSVTTVATPISSVTEEETPLRERLRMYVDFYRLSVLLDGKQEKGNLIQSLSNGKGLTKEKLDAFLDSLSPDDKAKFNVHPFLFDGDGVQDSKRDDAYDENSCQEGFEFYYFLFTYYNLDT